MDIDHNYPIEPDDPPEVTAVVGNRRVGKTTMLRAFGESDHGIEGRPLLTNFEIYGLPYIRITPDDLRKLDERFQGATILLHELSRWADAYDFFKKDARRLSKLVSELGKRKARLYYDDQRFLKIPARVRSQTDLFILMEKTGIKGIARVSIFDEDYNEIRSNVLFDGRPYWGGFNSFELSLDREDADEAERGEHPIKAMSRERAKLRLQARTPDEAAIVEEAENRLRLLRA